MPKVAELGTSTAKRPGSETSWVRRAPLAPMGFLVTWQMIVWPGRSISSMRAAGRGRLDVFAVEADVASVEHAVLRDPDVDEGRLHARQHVLDPTDVDVAVDLGGLVASLATECSTRLRPSRVAMWVGPPATWTHMR